MNLISQQAFSIPSIEETGLTFIENAILKARHTSLLSGLPAIADDSGLEVDALAGKPGIYSARYAGEAASSRENINKLLVELSHVPESKRQARFRCVLVYMQHAYDPSPVIGQGSWAGTITQAPQGSKGFGYDPIFYVPEFRCTAAQLPLAQKNKLSHRHQALVDLVKQLKNNHIID